MLLRVVVEDALCCAHQEAQLHCLGKFIVFILIWMSIVCRTSSLCNALNVMLAVTCNYSRFLEFTQNTFCYRSRDGLYHCRICRALVMDPVIPGADCLFLLLLVLPAELALYFVVLSFLKNCIVFGPEVPNYMAFYWTYSIFEMRPNYLAHKHILLYSY